MQINNNKGTPKKETAKNQTSSIKTTSIYDDDNIPEIDTNTFVSDELPKKDSPLGE